MIASAGNSRVLPEKLYIHWPLYLGMVSSACSMGSVGPYPYSAVLRPFE